MCIFGLAALGGLAGAGGGAAAGGAAAAGGGFATALQALGTLAGVAGTISSGIGAQRTAEYNAKVADNNAIAEKQRAAYEADMTRDRVRQTIGAQRAAGAASGLDIKAGTPVEVLGDTAKQGELDVLARLYGGDSAATAFRNDATMFRAQGKAQKSASMIGAGTSLLTGFGKIAASRARF